MGLFRKKKNIPRVITDRVFAIGLTELYRLQMKKYETETLLPCAEKVAKVLKIEAQDVPIEGYYSETKELTRYFCLVRRLQFSKPQPISDAATASAFEKLHRAFSSPAMGRPSENEEKTLLPQTDNPMNEALRRLQEYSIEEIVAMSREMVSDRDAGLIAVAASTGDALPLCAARESMALQTEIVADIQPADPTFEWNVSPHVTKIAERFVDELQKATDIHLPPPAKESSEAYWEAANTAKLDGRCICLVDRREGDTDQCYHWYINGDGIDGEVAQFWADRIWTTHEIKALPEKKRPR